MTSPNRSVIVRLSMEPSSYISGASRAAAATSALNKEVGKTGGTAGTSMEKAAKSAAKAEGSFGKLDKAASVLGVSFTGLAAAGGAVAVALSIKSAADFQQSLTKLSTTAGESQKNLGLVGDGILSMAGKVGLSANELAKGMYTVESSGIHGADALTVLKAAAQGAVQEQADLGKVTDAVTTALHDYNLPASDAAKVTSQLVTAVSHGKTTFDELTGAMHSVTPLAAALHVPLADIAGTLSAMTASGESADQAAQNMADALRHMQNPTSTMTAELAQLGINSAELGPMLGQKGLAGTIQTIASAIVDHLDPATKQVLLPALNKSKTAAQDLQIMIGQMPPSLAKMSQGFLDGSVSIKDYQKAAKDMGGQNGAMALQFLGLVKSSQGFNNILKAGGPAAQTYTAALQKAMGTSAGLTVALQVTGDHAAATNAAIKDIGKSAGDTSGNIKGWAEVQGNFNQQLHEAESSVGALAIQFGQHMLPVLTTTIGFINRDVIPGIGQLGSGIGTLAHDFTELPGPVKDTVLAFAGIKLVMGLNFLGVSSGLAAVKASMAGLSAEMASQRALYAEEAAGAQIYAAALGELDAAQVLAAAGSAEMSAASVAASAAMGGIKSVGSSLLSFLGGPWGVGLIAAGAAVFALKNVIDDHNAAVKADTEQVTAWYKAISSEGGQASVDAITNLKNKRIELAAAQAKLNDLQAQAPGIDAAAGRGAGALASVINMQKQKVADLSTELTQGQKAAKAYWDSLTPQGKLAATTAADEANLALAIQKHTANSREAHDAAATYNTDLAAQKELTGEVSAAEQTQIDKLNTLANVQLGAVSSALAASQSQSQLNTAISQYNKDAADGQHSTSALADESNALAQQAISTAQAVGKQAADQAAANGKTDDGTLANATMLASLREAAKHITGPGHDALMTAISDLEKTTVQHNNVADAASKMGLHVEATWDHNTRVISGATDQQIKDLENLNFKVTHLKDGRIVVTTDTGPARAELDRLIKVYQGTTLTLAGNYHVAGLNGQPGGTSTKADGGPIIGPGTGTSDTAGLFALSNGEHVWTAAEVQAAGGHSGVEALRKTVLSAGHGLAAGGPVGTFNMYDTMTAHLSASAIQQAMASIHALAAQAAAAAVMGNATASGPNAAIVQRVASGYGWGSGAEWAALASVINRESGFRNTAQNPTSTAYGMFQFLDGTWAGYGVPKTSDSYLQSVAGVRYIASRYGDPLGALRHEQSYGWYEKGTDSVPHDGLAYLHKDEAVIPAKENRALRSLEMAGAGRRGTTVAHTDARSYPITIQAAPNPADVIRRLQDAQRDNEFLHG